MKLEHASPDWLKTEVKKIFTKHLDPTARQFFFFGSRVKGNNFERADIDINDFEKSIERLSEVLDLKKTDVVWDSAIKRFEICFDLAWKAKRNRRWLNLRNLT